MKVSGTSGPSATGGARPASGAGAAPGFRPIVSEPAAGPASVSSASGVARVTSLDALMALQEVGGPLERRRRSVSRANRILDALEALKIGLLEGELSPAALSELAGAVRDQRALTDDPRLEGLLDEVETRAAVEMAKLDVARAAA